MGRPRRITDAQIDAAARATFLEHGHVAPVALIATRLGVSHAALLHRAGSKDALLLRALAPRPVEATENEGPGHRFSRAVAALREPPPDRGRAARLVALLVELHDVLADLLPGLIVLRSRGLPTGPPPGREAPTLLLRRLLTQWLERTDALSFERASALSEALLGAVEARCFNGYLGGPTVVGDSPRALASRLVSGLVPELGRGTRTQKRKARRGSPSSSTPAGTVPRR